MVWQTLHFCHADWPEAIYTITTYFAKNPPCFVLRDDDRFEVARALDLLPHVAGASFATVHFRLEGRKPARQEYRNRAAEYFKLACQALDVYPSTGEFEPLKVYIRGRVQREADRMVSGHNPEIEKRYNRYIDYR